MFFVSGNFLTAGCDIAVVLEYIDGTVEKHTVSPRELSEQNFKAEGLFECTVQFTDGECTVTASNCNLAIEGFEACACAAGHDYFC